MWSEVRKISLNVFDFLMNGDFSLWIVLYYSVPQHWFLFPIFVFLSETVISYNRLCSVFLWTLRFLTSQEVGRILSVKAFTLPEVGHQLTGLGLNKTMKQPQAKWTIIFFFIFLHFLVSPLTNKYETNILYILECIQNIKWPTVYLLFRFLLLYNESVGRRLSFSFVFNKFKYYTEIESWWFIHFSIPVDQHQFL